ncbi:MAG TPA: cohesin domain-containing protein [Anaerolineaceae bacterium]|nr:cohesin domain-containing protein [Anaerolineaceae bacterium]
MKIIRCLWGAALLSLLLLPGGLHHIIAAQGEAAISILPASSSLDLNGNNSVTLQVYVENMVELNAFDITVTYDAALLNLTYWAHGGILTNLWEAIIVNDPGYLRLAFAQLATPGFTGSGVLLYLTFQGVSLGISPITLADVHLSDSLANPIPVQIHHGQLSVFTYASVYGSFGLEGQVSRGGIPVTLESGVIFGAGPYRAKTLNQSGINLTLSNVMTDTYTVTTAQPRCLNVTVELNKTIHMTGAYTMQPLTLRCGNAQWADNIINVSDVGIVGGQWGLSQKDLPVGQSLNGDVNFDNIVNIRDLALVAGNYGLSSADVYTAWTP